MLLLSSLTRSLHPPPTAHPSWSRASYFLCSPEAGDTALPKVPLRPALTVIKMPEAGLEATFRQILYTRPWGLTYDRGNGWQKVLERQGCILPVQIINRSNIRMSPRDTETDPDGEAGLGPVLLARLGWQGLPEAAVLGQELRG